MNIVAFGSAADNVCPLFKGFWEHHVDYLVERAIRPADAARAGLCSVDAREAARMLGRNTPLTAGGLAIPYPGTDPPYVRVRMDAGTDRYLAPAHLPVPIYVPPGFDLQGTDAFAIVEGPVKALALQQQGIDAVGLGGTSTCLTTDGDRRLNEPWQRLRLLGRRAVILFDSNRLTNPCVARDEARLASALDRAGAAAYVAQLPHDERGEAWGPDDFISRRGAQALREVIHAAHPADPVAHVKSIVGEKGRLTAEQVSALVGDPGFLHALTARPAAASAVRPYFPRGADLDRELRRASNALQRAERGGEGTLAAGYEIVDGAFALVSQGTLRPFTNFVLQIDQEVTLDDGVELRRVWSLSGSSCTGETWEGIRVAPAEVARPGWHLDKFGAGATLEVLAQANNHLVAAVQAFSSPIKRVAYAHTGWRQIGSGWCFLHAEGAVGADGVETRVEGSLARYKLPAVAEDAPGALRIALRLLDLAPDHIAFPLLLAAFRAPLCELLPFDAAIHLHGLTGACKSSILALTLSFFGDFAHDRLPASWHDTPAALENILFLAKDLPVVIDDLAPKSADPKDPLRAKASVVFRAVGNRSARARMRSDLTARPTRPPRCFVISSGEAVPEEASILARLVAVTVRPKDVDLTVLTELQRDQGRLPHAMREYIGWVARHWDDLKRDLPPMLEVYRLRYQRLGGHLRSGAAAANLAVAGEVFIQFAMELQVFCRADAEAFLRRMHHALTTLLEDQASEQLHSDPARVFLERFEELRSQRRVTLLSAGSRMVSDEAYSANVGWHDAKFWYLIGGAAYGAVAAAARESGVPLAFGAHHLWRRLADLGLVTGEESGRNTVKRRWGSDGAEIRVVRINLEAMRGYLGVEGPPIPDAGIGNVVTFTTDLRQRMRAHAAGVETAGGGGDSAGNGGPLDTSGGEAELTGGGE